MANTLGDIPIAQAQDFSLPAPGVMVHLSPEFNPPILKGIKVHPDNPFRFDFILDKSDSKLSNSQLKDESSKLIKYFLASLTIPEKDLWVNLSPYEKDRIIPNSFGLTEMGRDLLAEDYMLKQITASLIYPEDGIGKKFWKRIYENAVKKYGTTNIPVNTFNKVWIVPEKAVVYENAKAGTAYVVESKLKVMLEQDYLSLEKHEGSNAPVQGKDTSKLGSDIVREVVIPELTKEVNENKNFAKLRQVYNSLILATWYKRKIKESILAQVYADKNKVTGINIDDPNEKEKIYQKYLMAFKKGVFNYIKEDVDLATQETVPRKYFSGGLELSLEGKNLRVAPAISVRQFPRGWMTGIKTTTLIWITAGLTAFYGSALSSPTEHHSLDTSKSSKTLFIDQAMQANEKKTMTRDALMEVMRDLGWDLYLAKIGAERADNNASWRYRAWLEIFKATSGREGIEEAKIAAGMEDFKLSFLAWRDIAEALVGMGRIEEAKTAARQIDNSVERSRVWVEIYKATSGQEDIEEARTAARQIEFSYRRSLAWAKILKATSGKEDMEEAKTAARQIDNSHVRSEAWAEILKAALGSEGMEEAKITAGMERVKDLVAIGEIAEAKEAAGQIRDSHDRFFAWLWIFKAISGREGMKEVKTAAGQIDSSYDRSRAWAEILKALASMGRIEEAKIAAGQIDSSYERSYAWLEIYKATSGREGMKEAKTAAGPGQIKNIYERCLALVEIYKVTSGQEEKEEAKNAARVIENSYERCLAWVGIYKATSGREGMKEARTVADLIENSDERSRALVEISKAILGQEAMQEAIKAAGMENGKKRFEAQWEIVRNLVGLGKIEEAKELAGQILDSFYHFSAWLEIFKATSGREGLEQTRIAAGEGEDVHRRSLLRMHIVQALAGMGRIEEAKTEAEGIEDVDQLSSALMYIANALAGMGRKEEAKEVARHLIGSYDLSRAWVEIYKATSEPKAIEEAETAARQLDKSFEGSKAWDNIFKALVFDISTP